MITCVFKKKIKINLNFQDRYYIALEITHPLNSQLLNVVNRSVFHIKIIKFMKHEQ